MVCQASSTTLARLAAEVDDKVAARTPQIGSAKASPTKEFFVRMLTRDIELQDAILDLLDNCVDGILRSSEGAPSSVRPYDGYSATIILAPNHFQITDNCGGIPIETAKKYAFAMGRPPEAATEAPLATVGMYGIGMKRAIFKLGTEALVESRRDQGFMVEFTPEWMAADRWDDLPMHELEGDRLPTRGTNIEVYSLNEDVAKAFSDTAWIDEFLSLIHI